ncbi:ABC transporter ATP-binding protein [Corynebacterium sp. H127]|uniref:ABC transporter ATP-binding protein n=1 Tax=Corynebacterium sp. H127 TaxID=3133418 RepID=UPI0030B62835
MKGLAVGGLSAGFGSPVVRDVSFVAPAGQVTALVGPNGAGKSTLLAAIAGVLPCSGELLIDAHSIQDLSARRRAQQIAFVPQDTALTIGFSAAEVVALGRYPHRGRWSLETQHDREVTAGALEAVGAAHLAEQPVSELSGGERQLVHIARALAQDTPVLLLDEPVSALDLRHQVVVLELLRRLASRHVAVVVVLHDLNLVARWCDGAVLLGQGRVRAAGAVADVLTSPILEEVYQIPLAVSRNPHTGCLVLTPKPTS